MALGGLLHNMEAQEKRKSREWERGVCSSYGCRPIPRALDPVHQNSFCASYKCRGPSQCCFLRELERFPCELLDSSGSQEAPGEFPAKLRARTLSRLGGPTVIRGLRCNPKQLGVF